MQAKYKIFRPVNEDTLIFRARDYFSRRHRSLPGMAASAWFYSGCVLREQKEYQKAMHHYDMAAYYATESEDTDFQGLVRYNTGDLFAEQGLYEEALDYYAKAQRSYIQSPGQSHEKQAHCLSAIGRMHMFLEQTDSAFLYFGKGMEIAESAGDKNLESLLAQNLSVAYIGIGHLDKAEIYLRKSYLLNADSTEIPRYYLNFAELYSGMGQTDSVAWYAKQLKRCVDDTEDDYFKVNAYFFLAEWEKAQADYDASFADQEARMEALVRIIEKRSDQSVYEAHRKYNYERMEKQYYRDLITRQWWIIVLLTMVMAGGILSICYWFRQRGIRMQVQRNVDTLQKTNRELENAMLQNQLMLRKDLLWRFNVLRKVMDLNKEMNKPDNMPFDKTHWMNRFNKIVYGKEDIEKMWDILFETINEVRPGITEKLRENYPCLTEIELRVCMLVYAGFDIRESALTLGLSPNTIQARRSDVRRKMGLGSRGDIVAHIDRL